MKITKIILLLLILKTSSFVQAQGVIENRTILNSILTFQRADEDFENYLISDGGAGEAGGALSSTNGRPVVSGITISSTYPDMEDFDNYWFQWNGNGYDGSITKTIQTSSNMKLDFWNPTSAFGLDLKDYPLFRRVFIAGVTVYGADDTTILYSDNALNITDPANGLFFGFQNPGGGIGSVIFTTIVGNTGESPLIDNLAFSTAPIPEPSVMAFGLLGLGALTLRFRKM